MSLLRYPRGYLFMCSGLLCAILPGGRPESACGYARLYRGHPFEGRGYGDPEIKALRRRTPIYVSYADRARQDDPSHGWWLGLFSEPCHAGYNATLRDHELAALRGLRALTRELIPRRYTAEEFAAYAREAFEAGQQSDLPFLTNTTPLLEDALS